MTKQVTVREALQRVADHPDSTDDPVVQPVHRLVCSVLFDIANHPNVKVRGSMAKASRAQRMILNRLVGTRRGGTNPATQRNASIDFIDLTAGVLE